METGRRRPQFAEANENRREAKGKSPDDKGGDGYTDGAVIDGGGLPVVCRQG